MSDFARLKTVLAKLGGRERAPGEGRKLKGGDAEALLAALVTEIDETILPRRLTLGAGSSGIHIAVANRRLQALLAPAPEVDGAEALAGQPLPDAEDPGVPALKEVLLRAFDGAGPVGIQSRRLDVPFASDIGVPANLLARAWGVSEVAPPKAMSPTEAMTAFLGGLGPDVSWLRINGEEVADQGGAEDRLVTLGEQAAIFLDGYFAKFEALFDASAPACGTVIAPADAAGEAMFFVEYAEESAFLAAPPGEIAGIARAWQSLVAE